MKQILHILRKDLRHYWPEALAALAALCAYVWFQIRTWNRPLESWPGITGRYLEGATDLLLPLAWWFLVIRIIQGETSVGDRQFWVTRPYEWEKLLAAKVIFVLLTVNVPFFFMQAALLAYEGFNPIHHLPGLLWLQLFPLFLTLPVAALATVTSSLVRTVLAILAVVLYLIAGAVLSSEIPSSSFSSETDSLQAILFLATCVFVILWQYSKRRTNQSRLAIVALAAIIVLILVATPYRKLVARSYPLLQPPDTQLQFALLPPPKSSGSEDLPDRDEKVTVALPLSVSGVKEQSILKIRGVLLEIEASNGRRWDSGWTSLYQTLFSNRHRVVVSLEIPKKEYDAIKSGIVNGSLSLAMETLRDTEVQRFVAAEGEFALPGAPFCSANWGFAREIHCRAPLRDPYWLLTTDTSESTCPLGEDESRPKAGTLAHAWVGSPGSETPDFDFNPVRFFDFSAWSDEDSGGTERDPGICAGTPFTLSKPQPERRFQEELEFKQLAIDDYRTRMGRFTFGRIRR